VGSAQAAKGLSATLLWRAEVHRLRRVFLAAMGANEVQIEDAFCEALRTAQQQKSISSTTRAEASYTAYRGQKDRGQKLPKPAWENPGPTP
jgi:hypothetical protein